MPATPVDTIAVAERAQAALRFAWREGKRRQGAAITAEQILLGVLDDGAGRVGPGVASGVLQSLGVDKEAVRLEIESGLPGVASEEAETTLQYSDDARDVLTAATEEARALHHSWVGSEHFLLGILRGESRASQVLVAHGLSLKAARTAIIDLLGE